MASSDNTPAKTIYAALLSFSSIWLMKDKDMDASANRPTIDDFLR